jgi:hypothetical protein
MDKQENITNPAVSIDGKVKFPFAEMCSESSLLCLLSNTLWTMVGSTLGTHFQADLLDLFITCSRF